MKKLTALALAVAMVCGLTACSSSGSSSGGSSGGASGASSGGSSGDNYRVALLNKQDTNEYLCNTCNKIEALMEADGGITVERYDADGDSSAQLQQFEDCLSTGVDFIVVIPMDAQTLTAAVLEANDMGVPVLAADIKLEEGACDYMFVGSNNYELAYAQGQWLAEHMPENARILHFRFPPGSETSNNRYQGQIDALADSGRTDYEILATLEFDASQEDAMSKMEDAIQVYGDEFDVILVPADAAIYGSISAMEAANIDVPSKMLVGFDAEDACVKLIKEGKVDMSFKQMQDDCAAKVYEVASTYRDGGSVADGDKIMYIPGMAVDSTNVDEFLP